MQSARLQSDIDSIQRRIASVSVKLTTEMKVLYRVRRQSVYCDTLRLTVDGLIG